MPLKCQNFKCRSNVRIWYAAQMSEFRVPLKCQNFECRSNESWKVCRSNDRISHAAQMIKTRYAAQMQCRSNAMPLKNSAAQMKEFNAAQMMEIVVPRKCNAAQMQHPPFNYINYAAEGEFQHFKLIIYIYI